MTEKSQSKDPEQRYCKEVSSKIRIVTNTDSSSFIVSVLLQRSFQQNKDCDISNNSIISVMIPLQRSFQQNKDCDLAGFV